MQIVFGEGQATENASQRNPFKKNAFHFHCVQVAAPSPIWEAFQGRKAPAKPVPTEAIHV